MGRQMDCLELLASNVSTDFASMNYIHFAKVLRTLLAPHSNPIKKVSLSWGSNPKLGHKKKRPEQKFSLFFMGPEGFEPTTKGL